VPSLSDARSGCSVRSLRRREVGVEHHLRLAWGGEQRDAARKKVHLRVWQRVQRALRMDSRGRRARSP